MTVCVRLDARGHEVTVPERIHVRSVDGSLGMYPKASVVLRKAPLRREAVQTLARRLYSMRDELAVYEEANACGLIKAIDRFYQAVVVAENIPLKEAV